MADEPDERVYVVALPRVRHAIDVLLARDTHTFFIAYLWLRREASRRGTTRGLKPRWADLGERFLAVEGGPPGKPHLRPFWTGQRNAHQEWLNANLAGSYAPSSLRQETLRVVEVDADNAFVLRDRHWEIALKVLLLGARLPTLAVAAFLLRDRGLVSAAPPTPVDLIQAFREEFGYSSDTDEEFDTLFDSVWGVDEPGWLEPLEGEAGA